LETWGLPAESLLNTRAALSDDEWREQRYGWLAGDIAPAYLVQSRVVEWFLHGEDMRATNGVAEGWQVNWQHWPVFLTIDLGVRMLPWALAQAGHDLAGRSIKIDVSGAGAGVWHWGLGAGEVPTATPSASRRDWVGGRALIARAFPSPGYDGVACRRRAGVQVLVTRRPWRSPSSSCEPSARTRSYALRQVTRRRGYRRATALN
jgi:hypothetical protein